jgi:hypothetical protein
MQLVLAMFKYCGSLNKDLANLCKISLLVAFSFISSNQKKVIPNRRVQKGSVILIIHWTKYGGNTFFKIIEALCPFELYFKWGDTRFEFL